MKGLSISPYWSSTVLLNIQRMRLKILSDQKIRAYCQRKYRLSIENVRRHNCELAPYSMVELMQQYIRSCQAEKCDDLIGISYQQSSRAVSASTERTRSSSQSTMPV